MTETLFLVLSAVIVYQGVLLYVMQIQHTRQLQNLTEHYQDERKDLMDRIQAPSFAQYTSKVVKEIKAKQPEEEKEEHEFIS